MSQPRIGGSFAPPLSDVLLASYQSLVAALPASPVKDALAALLHCCGVWWKLPEPAGTAQWAHPSGKGTIVSLQADHARALDDHIPWKHELEGMKVLFESLDPVSQHELRNAAHHLLWHVVELDLGREPLTTDRL
jgi:hypothetical protein